MTVNL